MIPADHEYIQEEVGLIKAKLDEEFAMSGGQMGLSGYLKGAFKELSASHMRHRL